MKAFEINYWSYIHNPDPDATKGPDGEFGVCVQYNMTRGIHPESHVSNKALFIELNPFLNFVLNGTTQKHMVS